MNSKKNQLKKRIRFSSISEVFQYSKKQVESHNLQEQMLLSPTYNQLSLQSKSNLRSSQTKLSNDPDSLEMINLAKFIHQEPEPFLKQIFEKKIPVSTIREAKQEYSLQKFRQSKFIHSRNEKEESMRQKPNLYIFQQGIINSIKSSKKLENFQQRSQNIDSSKKRSKRVTLDQKSLTMLFQNYNEEDQCFKRDKTQNLTLINREGKLQSLENQKISTTQNFSFLDEKFFKMKRKNSKVEDFIEKLQDHIQIRKKQLDYQERTSQDQIFSLESRIALKKDRIEKLKFRIQKISHRINIYVKKINHIKIPECHDHFLHIFLAYRIIPIQYKVIQEKTVLAGFILNGLLVKLKKTRQQYSVLKLKREYLDQYIHKKQALFQSKDIIDILKILHSVSLKETQNLFMAAIKINTFYEKLLNLGQDIQKMNLIFQYTNFRLQQVGKLFFDMKISQDDKFQFEINLMKIFGSQIQFDPQIIKATHSFSKEIIQLKTEDLQSSKLSIMAQISCKIINFVLS